MGHIRGDSRTQGVLFPQAIDELIAPESVVRVIDAFVESLELASLEFAKVEAAATGRPPYDPGDLLKLYIYGYLNQVRSSRRLEREAARNVELLWLLNRLQPDHKTIANFRKDNAPAIVRVCRAFTLFCREQGLFGRELLAIDGSKFQAVASRSKYFTPQRIKKQQARIEERIREYLAALERSDLSESSAAGDAGDVHNALEALQAQRQRLQELARELTESGEKQHVAGEPEAKLMRCAHGEHKVAYNVQIAVDDKHKLIAEFDLTNEGNDQHLLYSTAELARSVLEAGELTILADKGYCCSEGIAQCAEAGMTAVVPMQRIVNPRNEAFFSKERFLYDRESDSYRCPAGQTLKRLKLRGGGYYSYGTRACLHCALRAQCTDRQRRCIYRHVNADAAEAAARRARENPHLMLKRGALVEHPFAGLKHLMGVPRFLLRGKRKASAEMALSVLGYNLKRVLNILGTPALLVRLAR